LKRYVVDASVAVKWLIPEEHSENAMRLLESWLEGGLELNAPGLLRLEVTSALTKYVERGIIDAGKAREGFEILRQVALDYHEEDWPLIEEALRASLTTDLTIYDAVYFVLARRLEATLITADRGLIHEVKAEIEVEDIRDAVVAR
jgi:predicted nucleic acid-binding protein